MGPFSEITARRTHVRFSPIGGRRPDKDHRRALRRVASAIAAMRASLGKFGVVVWNRTQAARVLRAGAHSTLHGVVFAILCLGSAVYRP